MPTIQKPATAPARKLTGALAKKPKVKAAFRETSAMKLRRASEMLDKLQEKTRELSIRAAETRARLS